MTIRPAKFGDIPALAALLEESYRAGVYADLSGFDDKLAKGMLMNAIQMMGHKKANAVFFQVATDDADHAIGFFMGMVQPIYMVGTMLSASDLFYVADKAHTKDRAALLDSFIAWAEENPRVVEIKLSTSDALMPTSATAPDWRALQPIYKRRGFDFAGDVFVRRFKK